MVARISTGKSLYGALAYNEKKVQEGTAVSLGAINSLADASRQGLYEKAKTLQALADRNPRTLRNTYHIALSFAPADRVGTEQLRTIAREYLEGIGFGGQPAYLYRHHDTANDHIHVVTTNIRPDGKRIADSFLGATKSQETRRAIEEKYGLVRAEEQSRQQREVQHVDGGSLKQHARHALLRVLKDYRPASLGELNAVLGTAAQLRLRESSGTSSAGKQWRGYSVERIDGRTGKEISASIKVSQLFAAGWSGKLPEVLARHAAAAERVGELKKLRARVRAAFAAADGHGDVRGNAAAAAAADPTATLRDRLRREGGIEVIEHRNAQGYLYGLHYVDQRSGYIYKASEVGKDCTAAAWRVRVQTDGLSTERREQLEREVQEYVGRRTEQLGGLRSAATRSVGLRELQEHVAGRGFSVREVTPYLECYRAAEERAYPGQLQRDRATLVALQRGIERLHPEARRGVLQAAGMVPTATGSYHRHQAELTLGPTRGVEGGSSPAGGDHGSPGRLSSEERTLLRQLGRRDGVGGLPQHVHVGSVDWAYWRARMPPVRARVLEERLQRNYVQESLQRATRSKAPVDYLLRRGVVVEPGPGGGPATHAYLHDAPAHRVGIKPQLAGRIAAAGYGPAEFARIHARLADPIVKQLYKRAEALDHPALRNSSGEKIANRVRNKKTGLPSHRIRTQMSGLLRSAAPQLYQQGLYDLLRNTDQEENPEVRRTAARQQPRLSD